MAFRPTQRNYDLGKALKKARKAAGLTQDDVADRLIDINQAKMSRYEHGLREVPPDDCRALLGLYQPEPVLQAEIERLSVVTDAEAADHISPNPDFMKLQDAEKDATEIRSATSESIPRELQCDQNTLLQYHLAGRTTSETQVLRGKRERELLLSRGDAPQYRQLLSVSSLYRVPGGPDLVREQAAHLLWLSEHYPQLSLQVVEFDAPALPHFTDMRLVLFAGDRKPVVYLPNGIYGRLRTEPKVVADLKQRWNSIQQAALSEERSRKLFHELARNGPVRREF